MPKKAQPQFPSRWVRICSELVNDVKIQWLTDRQYRVKFNAAKRGEINEFSPYIRVDSGRVFSREWAELRSAVFERDNYTCRYCGAYSGRLECDHMVPVCRGGSNSLSNLATACFSCNRRKRSRTAEDSWS